MDSLIDLVNIREMRLQDLNFILDSSVKCLSKYHESMFKGWDHKTTCQYLEQVVLHILSSSQYSTFIACHRDNEDQILAYIVADSSSNHVLLQFTKYVYRKLGIQKEFLLPLVTDASLPLTCNYQTREMLKLARVGKTSIIDKLTLDLINEGKI